MHCECDASAGKKMSDRIEKPERWDEALEKEKHRSQGEDEQTNKRNAYRKHSCHNAKRVAHHIISMINGISFARAADGSVAATHLHAHSNLRKNNESDGAHQEQAKLQHDCESEHNVADCIDVQIRDPLCL